MTTVQIDIAKLSAAITAMESLASAINVQSGIAASATPIYLETLSVGTLGIKSQWLTDQLPELKARRDLAILLDTDGNGTADYTVAADSLQNVETLLGQELAAGGQAINPAFPEEYAAYTEVLARWTGDTEVMATMYTELGAEGTLRVMSMAASDDAGRGLDPAIQQQLLEQMQTGLETATQSSEFDNEGFAAALVDQATIPPDDLWGRGPYNPSGALAFLLDNGSFHTDFLSKVAEDLDHYERVENNGAPGLWGNRPDQGVDFGQFGDWYTYDNLDPMTGLMSAMENDPQLALEFFSDNDDPDKPGEGIASRAYYYLHERSWDQDAYGAISGVIDVATTDPSIIADPESQNAQNAALLVSKYVDYMSTRENFDEIVERGKWTDSGVSEHTANMLSTYMAGVDHALMPGQNGDVDPGVFEYTSDADRAVIPNMPLFDRDSLEKLSLLALSDDDGFAAMRTGLNEYRAHKLGSIADQLSQNPDADTIQNGLTTALGADARMEGFFINVIQDDNIANADAADARTKAWVDFGSDVVGMIPIPVVDDIASDGLKNIVNGAIDRGRDSAETEITNWLTTNGTNARATAEQAAEDTLSQQSFVVAALLADRGLAANPDLVVPTWEQYQTMSDSEQAAIRSELFSMMEGVGGYFNIDDYNQAYSEEFQEYFE